MRKKLATIRDQWERAPTAARVVATPYVIPLLELLELMVSRIEGLETPAPVGNTCAECRIPKSCTSLGVCAAQCPPM